MPSYDIALFTHRGAVRSNNQDAILAGGKVYQQDLRAVVALRLTDAPHALLIADGIGGQPAGDLASRTALHFLSSRAELLDDLLGCEAALHAANEHLYQLMDEPGRIGMGTTIAGLVLQHAAVVAFNVGDSRAYRLGEAGLVKLSHEDVASDGDQAGRSHAITQALGGSPFPLAIAPHVSIGPPMRPGEGFVLCTDGLTDVVDDAELEDQLRCSATPAVAVERLVRRAIAAGSRDNVSVIVGVCQ